MSVFLPPSHPWYESSDPIWCAQSFSLRRNLKSHHFPSKLRDETLIELLNLLKHTITQVEGLSSCVVLPLEQLTPQEKDYLGEHFLEQERWLDAQKGQALLIDSLHKPRLLCQLNRHDHLQLQWLDNKGEWERSWKQLLQLDLTLGQTLAYAFCPRFGYHTSDPKTSGTSLFVRIYLHLPCLAFSGELPSLLESSDFIMPSGLLGKDSPLLGDILLLQNGKTLGVEEETIRSQLHQTATRLVHREMEKRALYQETPPLHLQDEVARAYALLSSARSLQLQETIEALSKLKLALHLNWLSGLRDTDLNALLFSCQRGHLIGKEPQLTLSDKEGLHAARGSLIRKALVNTSLSL